jgi:hypothetical protein
MIIAQSNSAGDEIGPPQGCRTWCGDPERSFSEQKQRVS